MENHTQLYVQPIIALPYTILIGLLAMSNLSRLLHSRMQLTLMLCVTFVRVTLALGIIHRGLSHDAFVPKTKRATVCLFIAACLAHQGDPYQWAVIHGHHHRFCDTDKDPHSPTVMGVIPAAIAPAVYRAQTLRPLKPLRFFQLLTTSELYRLRNCVYLIQTMEPLLVWYMFGLHTAGVAITSSFFSVLSVFSFNVLFHFSPCVTQCKADSALTMLYAPFSYLARSVVFLFGEDDHDDHHKHPRRLIRSDFDLTYFLLIKPLMYFQCVESC